MGLRNAFGDIALEETQKEIGFTQEDLLIDILRQLKIMNMHLAHISDQRIQIEDIEEGLQ
jgi:hypothetical protein